MDFNKLTKDITDRLGDDFEYTIELDRAEYRITLLLDVTGLADVILVFSVYELVNRVNNPVWYIVDMCVSMYKAALVAQMNARKFDTTIDHKGT